MSKNFDYAEFNDGSFVFAQDKYSKEKALEIAKEETDVFDDYELDDVKEGCVAYRFDPDYCMFEFDSQGGYFIVPAGSRGSFKVWVIS